MQLSQSLLDKPKFAIGGDFERESCMKSRRLSLVAVAVIGGAALVMVVANTPGVAADQHANQQQGASGDQQNSGDARVQIGLDAAPVPLNVEGKNRALVGLGSYYVNVVGDCNGCHSAGPQTEYLPGNNPYLRGQTAEINPATYLGGGRDFGQVFGQGPHIISRNLTPDKTGMPEGGHTFDEFRQIIRTGVDLDNLHPNCNGMNGPNCFNPPVDGSKLQIMPWPTLSKLSDNDLLAIYTYLSTIPCLSPTTDPNNVLFNDCGP